MKNGAEGYEKYQDGSSQEEWDEDAEESEDEFSIGNQKAMNDLIDRKNL